MNPCKDNCGECRQCRVSQRQAKRDAIATDLDQALARRAAAEETVAELWVALTAACDALFDELVPVDPRHMPAGAFEVQNDL